MPRSACPHEGPEARERERERGREIEREREREREYKDTEIEIEIERERERENKDIASGSRGVKFTGGSRGVKFSWTSIQLGSKELRAILQRYTELQQLRHW